MPGVPSGIHRGLTVGPPTGRWQDRMARRLGPNGRCLHRLGTARWMGTEVHAMLTSSMLEGALPSGWFAAGSSASTRARLADLADLTSHPAGTVILREGAPVDALGFVVDGRVAVRLAVPGRG